MNKSNLIFITAYQKDQSLKQNKEDFVQLAKDLKSCKYPIKIVEGYYKGDKEVTLMVEVSNNIGTALNADIHFLTNVASIYGQESILLVNRDNSSELIYPATNKREYIGKMRQVSKFSIDRYNIESYTKINNNFFTAS